jgi:hypothetical protein
MFNDSIVFNNEKNIFLFAPKFFLLPLWLQIIKTKIKI